MSKMSDAFRNALEEANEERMGVHFLDLEEVLDPSVDQPENEEIEREELRRRLCEAGSCYRQERELQDQLYQHELNWEADMKELAAENELLTERLKALKQQEKEIRKRREEEEEEEARRQELSEEESRQLMDRAIYIRKMEEEKEKLRQEQEDLTSELEQLSLRPTCKTLTPELRAAEQESEHKLRQLQELIRSKDEEIEKVSTSVTQKNNETKEKFNTIEVLRQEQRQLREQLSRRQEEQILAAQTTSTTTTTTTTTPPMKRQGSSWFPFRLVLLFMQILSYFRISVFFGYFRNLLSTTQETKDEENKEQRKDERPLKNRDCWWCLRGLWRGVKSAASMAVALLLAVGIVASVVPVCDCSDPDCNLCVFARNLLESYDMVLNYCPIPTAN